MSTVVLLLAIEGIRRGLSNSGCWSSTFVTVTEISVLARARASRALPSAALQKAIISEAGITEKAIAQELGCHRVTVSRWVQGHRRPSGDLLTKYVELLSELQAIRHGVAD